MYFFSRYYKMFKVNKIKLPCLYGSFEFVLDLEKDQEKTNKTLNDIKESGKAVLYCAPYGSDETLMQLNINLLLEYYNIVDDYFTKEFHNIKDDDKAIEVYDECLFILKNCYPLSDSGVFHECIVLIQNPEGIRCKYQGDKVGCKYPIEYTSIHYNIKIYIEDNNLSLKEKAEKRIHFYYICQKYLRSKVCKNRQVFISRIIHELEKDGF